MLVEKQKLVNLSVFGIAAPQSVHEEGINIHVSGWSSKWDKN